MAPRVFAPILGWTTLSDSILLCTSSSVPGTSQERHRGSSTARHGVVSPRSLLVVSVVEQAGETTEGASNSGGRQYTNTKPGEDLARDPTTRPTTIPVYLPKYMVSGQIQFRAVHTPDSATSPQQLEVRAGPGNNIASNGPSNNPAGVRSVRRFVERSADLWWLSAALLRDG